MSTRIRTALVAAALATVPALAYAQEAPVVAPTPDAAITESATADQGQLEDSNIDHTILMPTAQTQPKGAVAFNDYELLFLGLSYGVTDDFQISGTTMVPLGDNEPFFGILSAKARIVKQGPMRVAAQGALYYVNAESFGDSDERDSATAFSVGLIASACLDAGCGSLASGTATIAMSSDDDDKIIVYGGSLLQKMGKRTKLVLEVASAGVFGGQVAENLDGAILSYGVRFFSGEISGDVAMVKPLGGDLSDDDDAFPLGFPFVNFTYRAL